MKSNKPVIAFDASPLLVNKTGVAYYTDLLIDSMSKQFPDAHFVGFYYNFLGRKDDSHLKSHKNISYKPIKYIPSKIVYQLRRMGISIPLEVLLPQKIDFVLYPNFLGYPSIRKTPSANTIHDLTYIDLPQYVAKKNRSDLQRLVPKEIKRSKFIITVSDFSKKRIQEVYKTTKGIVVTPIPPGKPITITDEQSLKELKSLGVTDKYILFLGTIEPRKNIPKLVEAYLKLPDYIKSEYQLVIVGRIGWNCNEEIQLLNNPPQGVIHLGYVSDEQKDILYSQAYIFAHASHYEGFGMPVLEAMNYGVPCAISNIPVFKEVAEDSAIYFNQDDTGNIAATLDNLITDKKLYANLSKKSVEQVAKITWDKVAKEIFAKIESSI